MSPQVYTLSNGIRVVHQSMPNVVAHFAVFINTGTRDEKKGEHGMAHFIEHTLFKGTSKRNLFQVLNRLDNVGADLNAYTTKEDTCIYASFLGQYYERVIELIHDISFHSVFPEPELEKEKQVIMDEIRSYLDSPSDQIYDDFEDLIFKGHPLGKNILGSLKSLGTISREKLLDFIKNNYNTNRMVICSVGNIDFKRLMNLVKKYFGAEREKNGNKTVHRSLFYTPSTRFVHKKLNQVHCIIGGPAFAYDDPRRIPLALMNNMLGGPLMNSRLSIALRERNGLTYQVDSTYSPYTDTGAIAIYFGTDSSLYEKAIAVIYKELRKLREKKLGNIQLRIIQKQLKSQLAIANESNLSLMFSIGKSFLVQNRYDPIEVLMNKIDAVTSVQLQDIANEIFSPERMSLLAFLPSE